MKVLRKRPVALLLCILIIIGSTLVSVHIKFGRKCSDVRDLFYYGEASGLCIGAELTVIGADAVKLAAIADLYDLGDQADAVRREVALLADVMRPKTSSMRLIRMSYESLLDSLAILQAHLDAADLGKSDRNKAEQYQSEIQNAQDEIAAASYNETVRVFLRRYDHFPTDILAALAGINMPEQFA